MCPILKQPTAVFGSPSCGTETLADLDRYISEVATALQRVTWDHDVLELLEMLPQIFLRFEDKVELGHDSLPVLLRHLHVVWQSYQASPNHQLEELIQLSPEYSYHLLCWARAHPERPLVNKTEKFRETMLLDPYWAIRWLRCEPDQLYRERIVAFAQRTREFNPKAAWFLHQMETERSSREMGLARLTAQMPLLLSDPHLCFVLLDVYPELDRRVLFRSAVGHPEYLLAWASRFPGEFEAVVQRELLRRPAWLVEYVARCQPSNANELLQVARERCGNRWLRPWLELYLQRQQ